MLCFNCKTPGYNYQKMGDKFWCGLCSPSEGSGRTITKANTVETVGAYRGYSGVGSVAALPKIASITEWTEIIRLCKKVSSSSLLLEETPKSLPLPNSKNPLLEKPSDKRTGWTPLDEYLKSQSNLAPKNLFEG